MFKLQCNVHVEHICWGGGVNIFEVVDAYYLGNYDIHSLYIIYGKKSTKFNPNMPLRKLTVHENGYQK